MFKQLGLGLLGLVLLPSAAIAQVQPQAIKIDPVYLGKDGEGNGVMLVNPAYGARGTVVQYLYGKGALKVRNRLAWFDCEKGTIVKIQQVYFGKTIEVNAPPKSEPFRLMLGIACANRHDDIEG